MINTQGLRYNELKKNTNSYVGKTQIGISFVTVAINGGKVEAAAWKIPSSSIKGFTTANNSMLTYLVDVHAGVTSAANNMFTTRIENHIGLEGLNVPNWNEIEEIAHQCYQSMPMQRLTIEVCISPSAKVRLLNVDITASDLCSKQIH